MDTSPPKFAIIAFVSLLCITTLNTGMCSLNFQCNEKDMHRLLNFKQGAIDPSHKLSSWSTEQDCCQWKGVKCDNTTSRVTELSLPCLTDLPTYSDKVDKSHCLTGTIHLSSLNLEFLNYLDLSNNDFLAIQFDYVDIQTCHNLSAPTPPRNCVNSSALEYLDLSNNRNLVIHNLQWLPSLSSVEYLDLGWIDLHRETNWLQLVTMLPSLSKLYLYECQLHDISPSLEYANFTAFEAFDLSENEFNSELPKWLFNLTCDISSVVLRYSFLKGQLPKELLNLPHLVSLILAENHFSGTIPIWLGQFEHLQKLLLGENLFSGHIPTSLGNLSSLISLDIQAYQLSGVVSERHLAKLSKLKILYLYSPALIFDFDSHWVPPFQLQQLALGPVGPKIPTWLYAQRSVEGLYIFDSSFKAPDKFWDLVSTVTTQLSLINNSIDGDLSNVLLNATFIMMSSNDLKGGLPRLSSNVAHFDASHSSFSGSISPLLCDNKTIKEKSTLKYLDISNNHLSGGLTNCWKNWKSLLHINLGGNNLTGKISPSMGLLSNLTSLHLHENKLFGAIPPSLQNCHSLLVLNVRDNNFSGDIPNWLPKSAMALQLRSNQFHGNIPQQICQMSSLIIFDFGDNKISGHIPNCMNDITTLVSNNASVTKLSYSFIVFGLIYYVEDSLELVTKGQRLEYETHLHLMSFVDLSKNNLSGTIPPEMFSLIGLHSLNLSYNNLMGRIPEEIGNMRNLESLDFSTNQLSGEIPQSMSDLSFLSYLNLSFNNFTGQIPSGTQLQGFSALSYIGNPNLCGLPLTKNCSSNDTKPIGEDEDKLEFMPWFYIGIESGFATSFLGVCGAIFLNRRWRHAYFKFLYDLRDRVYVMVVIKINSIR